MNWLRKALGLCAHKWKLLHRVKVFDPDVSVETPTGFDYVLQCEHCGDIKKVRT